MVTTDPRQPGEIKISKFTIHLTSDESGSRYQKPMVAQRISSAGGVRKVVNREFQTREKAEKSLSREYQGRGYIVAE
jgi:hypothetical protein